MKTELLQSQTLLECPGIVHGFTDRQNGVSSGAFRSLNLSTRVGDERTAVETNRRVVLGALGRPDGFWIALHQVHGDSIVEVSHIAGSNIEADGVWSRDRQAVVAVLVADCVPILIADKDGGAVAAVHAGWKGTKAHIAAKMVKRLKSQGFAPGHLRVALGPAIGPCCFQIGDDVVRILQKEYPDAGGALLQESNGGWSADLWELNKQALFDAGVEPAHTETLRLCTACDERFFSHRRDQGDTGRQTGIIGFAPRP